MIKHFEYLTPKTVQETLALLSQYKEEAKIMAGGQSLLLIMKHSPFFLEDKQPCNQEPGK